MPISKTGTSELVKKDQKNPPNSNISLMIKIIKPTTKPLRTTFVWHPKFLSSLMSVTQRNAHPIDKNTPNNNNLTELKLNNLIIPNTIVKSPQDKIIGQGLWSTKW